jgi:hypothetical protein
MCRRSHGQRLQALICQVLRISDLVRRHLVTLTQMRPHAANCSRAYAANSGLQTKLSLSYKRGVGLAELRPPGPATTGPILVAQNRKGFVAGPH